MYEYYYYYYRSSGICRDKLIINNFSTKFSEILSLLCKNHNLSTNDKVILINNRKVELDEEISKYIEKKSIKIIIGTMSGYIRNEKNRLMIEAQKYVLIYYYYYLLEQKEFLKEIQKLLQIIEYIIL